MLQAFELHDGSIVRVGGNVRTVRCLDSNTVPTREERRVVVFQENDGMQFLKDCEGEPLSEDWLLKFTFIERDKDFLNGTIYSYTYQDGSFTICCKENAAGRNEFWWATREFEPAFGENDWTWQVKLDFVHELQALFIAIEKKPLTPKT